MQQFSIKLAKELDWLPGAMAGSFNMAGPQFGPAMDEFRKNAAKMKGLPLLQYVSMGIAGNGAAMPTQPPAQQQQQQQGQAQQTAQDAATRAAQTGATGSDKFCDPVECQGCGRPDHWWDVRGIRAQEEKDQPTPATTASTTSGQPTAGTGSLMDMKTAVTSYSNSPLDASLFQVPAGYVEVKRNPDEMVVGK